MTPAARRAPAGHIVLVGYRGCGKTSVGRILAVQLARPFVDTDERIERTTGRTIRQIFEQDGETAFRRIESEALAAAVREPASVISVGGGAVLAAENRALLSASATCFFLTASVDELARRIANDPQTASRRPALTDASLRDEIMAELRRRLKLYLEVAPLAISTEGHTVEQVASLIVLVLNEASPPGKS